MNIWSMKRKRLYLQEYFIQEIAFTIIIWMVLFKRITFDILIYTLLFPNFFILSCSQGNITNKIRNRWDSGRRDSLIARTQWRFLQFWRHIRMPLLLFSFQFYHFSCLVSTFFLHSHLILWCLYATFIHSGLAKKYY